MGTRTLSAWYLVIVVCVFTLQSRAGNARADDRPLPNIIIMMVDDMGLGDTSAYLGHRLRPHADPIQVTLKTPQLDSLAQRGVLFTDAHAGASMCSSTRYSLLTGRFAHRSYLKQQGWLPHGPNDPMIQRELTTLPEMLQKQGYYTSAIGKYHVGMAFDDGYGMPADEFDFHDVDFSKPLLDGPTHHGFDEFFGVPGNTEDSLDTEPRVFIRNDRWTETDRSQLQRIGIQRRQGRILAAPDWDLKKIGAAYLREATAFIRRRAASEQPFFLYYVPNANHLQRNKDGFYAVPESLAGVPIMGQSQFSDGSIGGDRSDMVLENDVALGQLIELLSETPDGRRPGHRLIDNTLILFTSDNGPNQGDNLGWNQESGGLRGKKARLWEGGLRVPFMAYWAGVLEGGTRNESFFSLTDLFATLAAIVGYDLNPLEAQDSHNCLPYWLGKSMNPDERPRVFFCHLGPPYLNDALAIRRGYDKLIVNGGLAMPWARGGSLGAVQPAVYYDLESNFYERGDFTESWTSEPRAVELAELLLRIHNRGYARDLSLAQAETLPALLDDGWHNLRNDLAGDVGFLFQVAKSCEVTALGMWDSQRRDAAVRPARDIPDSKRRDRMAIAGNGKRELVAQHRVRLHQIQGAVVDELTRIELGPAIPSEQEGEFRYRSLSATIQLEPSNQYLLTMSTQPGDGDPFHDATSYDGLSPLVHPILQSLRSVLIRDGAFSRLQSLPTFSDLARDADVHRVPVGPTMKIRVRESLFESE